MQQKSLRILAVSTISTLLLNGSMSYANSGFNLSGEVGWNLVESNGSNNSFLGYGGRLGYFLMPSLELGLGYSRFNLGTHSYSGVTTSMNYSFLMADITYHPDFLPQLYFGPLVGLGIISTSVEAPYLAPAVTKSGFAVGGVIGYNQEIASGWSIGPRITYINDSHLNAGFFQVQASVRFSY